MSVLENLNAALSHLMLVDKQDLSALAAVISDIEKITEDTTAPAALKNQVGRTCKLAEHIILAETDFDTGLVRLTESIQKMAGSLNENSERPESDKHIDQKSVPKTKSNKIKSEVPDDVKDFRIRFASQQKSVLEDFEAFIMEMEKGDIRAKDAVKRTLHTWKGEFGVLEYGDLSGLIHEIEGVFEKGEMCSESFFRLKDYLSLTIEKMASGQEVTVEDGDCDAILSIDKKEILLKQSIIENKAVEGSSDDHKKSPLQINIQEIDSSLLADFIVESRDHIHIAENLLLELETEPGNAENLNCVFRACHTIKGVAGFLGLVQIGELSHNIENVMDQARKGELTLSAGHIDILLQSMDCLKELIANTERAMAGAPYTIPLSFGDTVAKLADPLKISTIRCSGGPVRKLGEILVNSGSIEQADLSDALQMQENGDVRKIGQILVEEKNVPPRAVAEAIASQVAAKASKSIEETIRVPVTKLDQLIDAIGEAVISQSMITADPAVCASTSQALHTKLAQTNLIMRQIQELSMSLRMVSVKSTFQKMARLVRDLSKKAGKEIDFESEGEDTELDKSVVEHIGDPLIHMVRNSVDHGIESEEERLSKRKPAIAKVRLKAYHKSGSVFIEIQDDGKGLDKEAIYKKAVDKGLCKPDDKFSDMELFQFIFLPGFSTAKAITDISGRGVGMDVVKRNIEALRGSIEIASEKDKGTTFTIRLPLTLAIIDGMIVRVETETFIIPTLSIVETLATSSENIVSVLDKGEMIRVRNNLIPLIHLSSVFGKEKIKLNGVSKVSLIVEDLLGYKTALLVDEIIGQQQVVIKSLGTGIGEVQGVSGGAIMSDGSVSLILDTGGIIRTALGS